MKKILFFSLFFAFALTTLYLLNNLTSAYQQISTLKKENTEYKKALEQNKMLIVSAQSEAQKSLKMKVVELQTQQIAASSSAQKQSGIGISLRDATPSKDKQTLSFWVEGPEQSLFDAMDLALSYSNIKDSPLCTTGDVFALYPLVESKQTYLDITGIADISGEKIVTGKISHRFATCIFEKIDVSQPAKVEIDPANTHIYFLGKSVLDLEKSFKTIVW